LAGADEAAVGDVCTRLLGRTVVGIARIHGGRNSQVFVLDCAPGAQPTRYVAKQYFPSPGEPRDRLGTEFRALELLKSWGVAAVPAPIAMDADARCAVYQFLPGERASLRAPDDSDIRQGVDLLADLRTVARRSGADVAAAASEACFSIDAIVEHVSTRAGRLRELPDDVPCAGELTRFLRERFDPFVSALDAWTDQQTRRHRLQRDEVLPLERRTLSPSDFGFHNALRDEHGRLTFVDFEYFGWDDPAKTIVDVLHHPAMQIGAAQRRAFVSGMLGTFSDVAELAVRARVVYPWFGLKWCLIVLNEFVPEDFRRRRFAGVATSRHDVLRGQLERAVRLFDSINAEYRDNPYFDR
jgi:hypothetical protein